MVEFQEKKEPDRAPTDLPLVSASHPGKWDLFIATSGFLFLLASFGFSVISEDNLEISYWKCKVAASNGDKAFFEHNKSMLGPNPASASPLLQELVKLTVVHQQTSLLRTLIDLAPEDGKHTFIHQAMEAAAENAKFDVLRLLCDAHPPDSAQLKHLVVGATVWHCTIPARNYREQTPDRLRILDFLFERISEPTFPELQSGLRLAAGNRSPELVSWFLKKGADPNSCNPGTNSLPLTAAIDPLNPLGSFGMANEIPTVVQLLITAGADPDRPDHYARTARKVAIQYRRPHHPIWDQILAELEKHKPPVQKKEP